MEIYNDGMLVKSSSLDLHTADLEDSFDILDKYGLKLYPTKCVFGVSSRQFLGFLVSN